MVVGWLPVLEWVKYHSVLQAKKNKETGLTTYLHTKLAGEKTVVEPQYNTRQTVGGTMSHNTLRL